MKYSLAVMALLGKVTAVEVKERFTTLDPEYYAVQTEISPLDPQYYSVNSDLSLPQNLVQRVDNFGSKKDNFDGDPDSVSPYDDMEFHSPGDFGVVQMRRRQHARDTYDGDPNTVSPYDAMHWEYGHSKDPAKFEGVQT